MPTMQEMAMTQPKNKRFWNFRAAADDQPPELILYGDISSTTWWGDEVTPRQFSDDLAALGNVPEIVVRINSGGGDVFAANAIYTRLKDNPAKITIKIDGWAASAATIIAMAGDTIKIPGNGVFMIHEAKMGLFGYYGNADFAKMTEEITVINNSIINGYALKTGKSHEEIAALMAEEKWYDGKQAVDAGFCDELMFEEAKTTVENNSKIIVNSVALDLSRFPSMPVSLLNRCAAHAPGGFSNKNNKPTTEKEATAMNEVKTVEELVAAYPALVAQAVKAAVNEERQRIQDIEEVTIAGFENIANDAKFKDPKAAGDVAKAILAEQKKQGAAYLANREEDVKNGGAGSEGAGAQLEGAAGKGGANEVDAAIDKLYPAAK